MNQLSTIDALLVTAARAETEATGPVQIVFDPVSGVPTDASIDWLKDAMDDEYGWHVSDFRRLGEAPTVSSDRPMFCDLAVRASEGHVAFGSPGETDALVSYNDLTAVQRDVLRSVLEDADERTKRGEGWDNRFLVSFVNDVCGLHLTPITMTP